MSYQATTKSGHLLGEVASAFQKSIRRGMEEEALYWAVELDESGFGEYAWKRMRVMTSEDIGLAEPSLPATVRALYETWIDMRKKKDEKHKPERLFFIHAVLLLVRAKKSRVVDHALIVAYNSKERREIPDFALDKHTARGKRKGRGIEHFFVEGMKLENHSGITDEYQERAKEMLLATETNGQGGLEL